MKLLSQLGRWILRVLKYFFQKIFQMCVMQAKITICTILGLVVLMGLFLAWDARLMSSKEVLECLTRIYGQDFEVVSGRSLKEAERAEGVARVKVYEVIPVGQPERQFWAFNIVTAEKGGLFGMSNGLTDTYALELLSEAFVEQAGENGLDYEFVYGNYPGRDFTGYYSHLNIKIGPVTAENLPVVCKALGQIMSDMLNQIPTINGYLTGLRFFITYREPDWPEDEACHIYLEPFYGLLDDDFYAEPANLTEKIQEKITNEVSRYRERKKF